MTKKIVDFLNYWRKKLCDQNSYVKKFDESDIHWVIIDINFFLSIHRFCFEQNRRIILSFE